MPEIAQNPEEEVNVDEPADADFVGEDNNEGSADADEEALAASGGPHSQTMVSLGNSKEDNNSSFGPLKCQLGNQDTISPEEVAVFPVS